ncbi:MAG: RidA family protein [Deltaproteobacteria bacterium]|nr:RidA family protein [Deltaproteobacteria bacterium]
MSSRNEILVEVVASSEAPKAIGPYSQAIRVTGAATIQFFSGQIGLDPNAGVLVDGGVEREAQQVLENLAAVAKAGGLTLRNVVRTTIYLTDLSDFERVNAVYERYFPAPSPARATVGVAALPRGARVEIDAIAVGPT